jgi:glutamine synthetase
VVDTTARRLRLLCADILGVERGKYLFGEVAAAGHAAFCIGLYPLTTDKEILPIEGLQFDIGLPDVEAELDRETLRPGWEDDTDVGIADIRRHGAPVEVDPRQVLRTAVAPWLALGLAPQIAFELEFFLLEPSPDGGWRAAELPSHRVYGTGAAVDPSGTVDDVVRTALAVGFPVESWCSEFDSAAFEVNVRYRDAIPAADEAFLFRLLVREVAQRHGRLATFMGRPFGDRGGSGLHLNLSFRREDGSNAFHDPAAADGLSDLARRCIGGLLAHHRGLAAVFAPHVNAYRRLQPDMLNGYWANWGFDDRTVCVRVPPARGERSRLEHRMADAAANPYLAAAALLHAARFGVEQELDPGPMQQAGQPPATDVHVPETLAQALDALEADKELRGALGEALVRSFVALKRAEWERYAAAVDDPATTDVTPWEVDYYLPFF